MCVWERMSEREREREREVCVCYVDFVHVCERERVCTCLCIMCMSQQKLVRLLHLIESICQSSPQQTMHHNFVFLGCAGCMYV